MLVHEMGLMAYLLKGVVLQKLHLKYQIKLSYSIKIQENIYITIYCMHKPCKFHLQIQNVQSLEITLWQLALLWPCCFQILHVT